MGIYVTYRPTYLLQQHLFLFMYFVHENLSGLFINCSMLYIGIHRCVQSYTLISLMLLSG